MPPLRLMTYNLRVDTVRDDEPSWPARRDAVASMIRFHCADVVGVQEALPHMIDDLDTRLDGFDWVGRPRDDGDEYCALFYRSARLSVAQHSTFWLSTTPDVPASMSWGAALPRIATWARLVDRRTDRPVVVCNTHFDHESAAARRESAHLLCNRLTDLAGAAPLAVLGDLNATPGAPPYAILTRSSPSPALLDALDATVHPHHGPQATFNGFDAAVQPGARIDYIFVRAPLTVRRHGTLTDRWDGYFPSDHCPVLAEVALPDAPPTGTG